MIHVGVGHSQSLSTTEAAERATRMAMGNAGIAKADLAIVFATINYQAEYHELYQAVQANASCDELIGCSGMSVLTSAGEFEGGTRYRRNGHPRRGTFCYSVRCTRHRIRD